MSDAVRFKDRVHDVGTSANGKRVYANLMNKVLAINVSGNPRLLRHAEEAISATKLTGETMCVEYDMGQSIGRSDIVPTTGADVVFYARLTKNSGYTRFVKNRQSDQTQFVTVSVTRDDEGDYEVSNVWLGKSYPVSPDSPDAPAESATYWENHAVLYTGQPLVTSSVLKTSPY